MYYDLDPHDDYEEDPELWATIKFMWSQVARFPDEPAWRVVLARVYERECMREEAAEEYETVLKLGMENGELHYRLGRLYYYIGRTDDAAVELFKSTRLTPEMADPWFLLGTIHFKGHAVDKAIEYYQKAVAAAQDHTYAHYGLGLSYLKVGRYDGALAEFKRILYFNPVFVDAKFRVEYIPRLSMPPDEEVNAAFYAVEKNPDSAEAHHWLGVVLLLMTAPEGFVDEMKKAVSIDPDNMRYRYDLACALDFTLSDLERFKTLAELLFMDPNNLEAMLFMVVLYTQNCQYDDAIRILNEIIEIRPDDDLPHYLAGSIYALMDMLDDDISNTKEASRELDIAIRLNPQNFNAHLLMAKIHEKLDNYDEAVDEYEHVLDIEPSIREAREGIKKWKVMKKCSAP